MELMHHCERHISMCRVDHVRDAQVIASRKVSRLDKRALVVPGAAVSRTPSSSLSTPRTLNHSRRHKLLCNSMLSATW
jgi:hypothetical protein